MIIFNAQNAQINAKAALKVLLIAKNANLLKIVKVNVKAVNRKLDIIRIMRIILVLANVVIQ